jgi:CBS-domain-containing membrane protein
MTAVHDAMSTAPVTVTPATSISDLLSLFDRHDFNALPVMERGGSLVGVVSKLDVLRLFLASGPALSSIGIARAADVMSRKVVTVAAQDNIVDAGNLMIETKLRSFPVVDRRQAPVELVGMLSRGDVLRALRFQLEEQTPEPAMSGRGQEERARVETLIDEIMEQTFPASDPPTWGVAGARLRALGRPGEQHPR